MTGNHSSPAQPGEPIAIVGSGCRFPGGANSPSKLWELLRSPRDVLKKIPAERFNPDGFYNPDGDYHGHTNVRHTYILDEDHRQFDAGFFNVSASEASSIDPQQRLLLETVYEALESAGLAIERLRGSNTAVYIGAMCGEYSDLLIRDLNSMPSVSLGRTGKIQPALETDQRHRRVVLRNWNCKIDFGKPHFIFL